MANRTFAIGDVHGDLEALRTVLGKLPPLDADDTLVFLGDYLDRGPQSAETIEFVRHELPKQVRAKIVTLRGNHEDGWLRVASGGWPEFVIPLGNGCLATLRSYRQRMHFDGDMPTREELREMQQGSFFPDDVVDWMSTLPYFHEDEHAIYVHAGLVSTTSGEFLHPSEAPNPTEMLWLRTQKFFEGYEGKRIVCGHTPTKNLPPDLSTYTPGDDRDMWVRGNVMVIDTGAGKGGFLTALELPAMKTYESRP